MKNPLLNSNNISNIQNGINQINSQKNPYNNNEVNTNKNNSINELKNRINRVIIDNINNLKNKFVKNSNKSEITSGIQQINSIQNLYNNNEVNTNKNNSINDLTNRIKDLIEKDIDNFYDNSKNNKIINEIVNAINSIKNIKTNDSKFLNNNTNLKNSIIQKANNTIKLLIQNIENLINKKVNDNYKENINSKDKNKLNTSIKFIENIVKNEIPILQSLNTNEGFQIENFDVASTNANAQAKITLLKEKLALLKKPLSKRVNMSVNEWWNPNDGQWRPNNTRGLFYRKVYKAIAAYLENFKIGDEVNFQINTHAPDSTKYKVKKFNSANHFAIIYLGGGWGNNGEPGEAQIVTRWNNSGDINCCKITERKMPEAEKRWCKVYYNKDGKQKHPENKRWSAEIYGEITGNKHSENEGGVNHNASWGHLNGVYLDKAKADWLCQNPCRWYNKGSTKARVNEMCNCDGGVTAKDFCQNPKYESIAQEVNGKLNFLGANDSGYGDNYRGWYENEDGKCMDYCRWVGNSGSGGDPHNSTRVGSKYDRNRSFWQCRDTQNSKEVSYDGKKFNNKKCNGDSNNKIFAKRLDIPSHEGFPLKGYSKEKGANTTTKPKPKPKCNNSARPYGCKDNWASRGYCPNGRCINGCKSAYCGSGGCACI